MSDDRNGMDPTEIVPRIVGGVFGFAFLGIGLTVLGFLWSAPFGEFGSPPLFFRLFGSFIAVVFVAVGGAIAFGSIFGKMDKINQVRHRMGRRRGTPDVPSGARSDMGYTCTSCGAPLASNADVSPHGDVKCTHCDRWFNIHSDD